MYKVVLEMCGSSPWAVAIEIMAMPRRRMGRIGRLRRTILIWFWMRVGFGE